MEAIKTRAHKLLISYVESADEYKLVLRLDKTEYAAYLELCKHQGEGAEIAIVPQEGA